MQSLREPADRAAILARLDGLEPSSRRQWGGMDAGQMLCHIADQLRMALRDEPTAPPSGPLRFAPMRYLAIHVLPWPRGKAKAPAEAFTTGATNWAADRAKVRELIERFGQASDAELAPTNPIFGPLSAHDWAVLSYRHLDHHLRQFSA
jgi:hypothetical protein